MVDTYAAVIKRLYAGFNARDVDGVLAALTSDVAWANGMNGGHVHGHEALRAYWSAQWQVVDPQVVPVEFIQRPDGAVAVRVVQTIRDLYGEPLTGGQTHDLKDKTVCHVFHFDGGKVSRFEIEDGPEL